jgi:hypothetical protein
MKIHLQIGSRKADYIATITDAPPSYDGFGTFTVRDYGHSIDCGDLVTKGNARLTLTPEEHLKWQTARYQSGLHAAIPAEELLAESDLEEAVYRRLASQRCRECLWIGKEAS